MNYEQKYKEALDNAKVIHKTIRKDLKPVIEQIFPELKESDDERIRKQIISFLKEFEYDHYRSLDFSSWIVWLEKQGEQKSDDKVEPKFKVGDWIVTPANKVFQITSIEGTSYKFDNESHYWEICYCDEQCRLWTIEDAKDGDVLATDTFVFIFKSINNDNGVHYYCHCCQWAINDCDTTNQFHVAAYRTIMGSVDNSISHYSPATKEQRNLLFQKMKEAGYEWNMKIKKIVRYER